MRNTSSFAGHRSRTVVFLLCGLAVMLDGYDLIVYGAVVPTLMSDGEWALTADRAGVLGAYPLAGMLLGAIVAGALTDRLGRRGSYLVCVAWFSAMMAFAALAPTPELFGLARFAGGIGLGGVMPTAIATTIEFAKPAFKSATNGLMFSGYSVGGIAAALAAIPVLPALGWRPLFWIGAVAGFALLPFAIALLPESPAFLRARGRHEAAEAVALRFAVTMDEPAAARRGETRAVLGRMFSARYRRGTLLFWLATAMALLVVYGLNTWLARIMTTSGYSVDSALLLLMVLNIGAIAGTGLLGLVADRVGTRAVVAVMFFAGGAAILLLSTRPATPLLVLLVAVAGACTIGTTIILNAFTALYYPPEIRATAIGLALGVGRIGAIVGPIYGGLIATTGWGVEANFYAFAIPAVIGGLAVLLIPAALPESAPTPTPEPAAERAVEA